ncbi:MAG TPA: DNA polymerase domain-containing protein [Meiothermus sp.]|nr:DNA polymerase domain-containing protein [Meiothermus sp.]
MNEPHDPWLFGWDPTPGIVSVWASPEGRALVWRRLGERVVAEAARFRPWLYAAHLKDLAPLGSKLVRDDTAPFSYRELPGPAGSLRYLVSARDGRSLERILLEGASRRLGREVGSLDELDDYYCPGAVEQYLIQTGRSYFRDLPFSALHRLQFDLETTDLTPAKGRIFMAAVRDSRGLEQILEAPRPEDEPRLIQDLCALIRERDPDAIENHNLMGFDLPFLAGRAKAQGIRLELGRSPGPLELVQLENGRGTRFTVAGREMLDTLDATWRVDFVVRALPSHGLKDVARFFGVAAEDRVYLEGHTIYETYQRDPEQVRRYALQDVGEVDAIARRLHTSTFALARMAPRRYERVAYAGTATGILEPMLVRAYLQAEAALPRSEEAPSSEPHAGGALILFATGVAERVVKADIASLYPSLIRLYGIGPKCDTLGAFVHLVDRLTALRLLHKAAAQRTEKSSLEHGEHEAMQAAMKLVVNSAYGYLGAGRMAWFADRQAADEITRRGREILQQVCQELGARGATLIEADTDGVYVSVPEGWDEARERALVVEVAATLPEGLRLEFDGRYRAMFSHEVKNYALLGYDGRLVVRGGALRSSRAEPFAEAWLQGALRCLLEGDIPGLRAGFLETVQRLQKREYTVAEVSNRAKLSKTPQQYAASSRSEAVYEAMLASGRSEWAVGERVRIYRASGGQWRVLSEKESDARDYDIGHYIRVLRESYAERLRKAFTPEDFDSLFRLEVQPGLFDTPLEAIQPLKIS